MTGLLRDLMDERAEHAHVPQLDLDSIIETGDKRVRRRKVVAGVGVAAVAAAVAAAFTLVPGVFDSDSSKPPAVGQPDGQQQRLGPFAEQRPTYGIGSIIQYGNDQLTVAPHTMRSLVQNDDGFAFVSTDGDVYFTDGETTEQIGDRGIVENTDIRADGSYVAWVDYTPDAPELVVYNTAAGEEVLRTAEGSLPEREMDDPYRQTTTIVDIDGGTVYWHNSIGIVATDMESLETETLNENAYPEFVHDVQNGVFSYVTDEGGVLGVGPNRDSKEAVFQADRGILSPSGTRVFATGFEGGTNNVYDVASEQSVTPANAEDNDIFVSWIDDGTYTIARLNGSGSNGDGLDLLQCSISADACTMLQPDFAAFSEVVWPGGEENGAK